MDITCMLCLAHGHDHKQSTWATTVSKKNIRLIKAGVSRGVCVRRFTTNSRNAIHESIANSSMHIAQISKTPTASPKMLSTKSCTIVPVSCQGQRIACSTGRPSKTFTYFLSPLLGGYPLAAFIGEVAPALLGDDERCFVGANVEC